MIERMLEQQEMNGITSWTRGTIAQGSGESGHVKGASGPMNGGAGQRNGDSGPKSAVSGLKGCVTKEIRVVLELVVGMARKIHSAQRSMRNIQSQTKVALGKEGGTHHLPCQGKGNLI